MALIPPKTVQQALMDLEQKGRWVWVVDGEEEVAGDKDHPPTHHLSGHWEYSPSLREVFEEDVETYNEMAATIVNETIERLAGGKGFRIPPYK